jgi:stearoyl-CoA desaturase (delta-9 desaturase)
VIPPTLYGARMSTPSIQRTEGPRVVIARLIIGHLAVLGAFFVPVTTELLVASVLTYFLRVFAIEGVAHRYFSHRSFKTSRGFQLMLAVLMASTGQRGPIWWAMHHRRHHRYSDEPGDPHSPVLGSRFHAYLGWLVSDETLATNPDEMRDLSRYQELVWINKYHYIFPLLTLVATYLLGQYTSIFGASQLGWSAVVWVFFVSTMAAHHVPYIVNTFAHGSRKGLFASRAYETPDTTSNLWWFAIPSMGAAWHNNHHRYMNAARAGFRWYELDLAYLTLRVLAAARLVWDLHEVPTHVVAEAG